jgi:hypothetical protein
VDTGWSRWRRTRTRCAGSARRTNCVASTPRGTSPRRSPARPWTTCLRSRGCAFCRPGALQLPRERAINFHDGPLPRYAGLNATCWSLLHGEREHAVTWHVIEPKADTGAILVQRSFAIAPDDTAFTLNARCFEAGQESFAELTQRLADRTLEPQVQDLARRTYFGKHARPPALAVLDFAQAAAAVARVVRAFDHGGYRNPIAVAKVRAPLGVFVPGGVEVVAGSGAAARSRHAGRRGPRAGRLPPTANCGCSRLRCLRGLPLDLGALQRYGVMQGVRLPLADAAAAALRTELGAGTAAQGRGRLGRGAAAPGAAAGAGRPARPAGTARSPQELAGAAARPVTSADAASRRSASASWRGRPRLQPSSRSACARRRRTRASSSGASDLARRWHPPANFVARCPGADRAGGVAALSRGAAGTTARGPLLRELVVRRRRRAAADHAARARRCVHVPGAAAPSGRPRPGTLEFAIDAEGRAGARASTATRCTRAPAPSAGRSACRCSRAPSRRTGRRPLAAVPILEAAELERLLRTWNDSDAPAPSEPCVHRQFVAMAHKRPTTWRCACAARR